MYGTLPFQGAYGSNAIGYTPGLGGSKSVLPAGATLEHYYPFRNDLNDRQTAASGTLTRASTVIYQDKTGDWVSVADDVPALTGESILLQGNISNVTDWPLKPTAGDETALTAYNAAYFDTPTLGNDSAGIGAAGFQSLLDAGIINGNYCRIHMTDTTNSYREFTFTGSQGNLNNCSLMALVRLVSVVDSNKPPQIKPIGGATLDFDNTDWQVVRLENVVRAGLASTDVFRIRCTEGVYDVALITTVEGSNIQTFIEGSGTQVINDLQLDSSTWPVNDCWYYLNFPNGIPDIGNDQYILETLLPDVSNRFLLQAQASANIRVANIVAGSFINVISFPLLFNTPFDLVFNQNSVTGGQLAISSGAVGTSAATADLMIGGLAQVGATNTLTSALNSYVSQLKVGTGSVTLEQARTATR